MNENTPIICLKSIIKNSNGFENLFKTLQSPHQCNFFFNSPILEGFNPMKEKIISCKVGTVYPSHSVYSLLYPIILPSLSLQIPKEFEIMFC